MPWYRNLWRFLFSFFRPKLSSVYLSVLVQFGNDTPFTRREEEGEVVIGSVVRSFAFASAPPQSLSSRKSSRSLSSSSSSSPSSTAKPTTKSTAVSVCLSVSQRGGRDRAKCCCLERAAAAAVLGSRPPRCWEKGRKGEGTANTWFWFWPRKRV